VLGSTAVIALIGPSALRENEEERPWQPAPSIPTSADLERDVEGTNFSGMKGNRWAISST
jgi:hypothetical protein